MWLGFVLFVTLIVQSSNVVVGKKSNLPIRVMKFETSFLDVHILSCNHCRHDPKKYGGCIATYAVKSDHAYNCIGLDA